MHPVSLRRNVLNIHFQKIPKLELRVRKRNNFVLAILSFFSPTKIEKALNKFDFEIQAKIRSILSRASVKFC